MLNELTYRLLHEDHQHALVQFRDKLNWIAQHTPEDGTEVSRDFLRLILKFHAKYGKCPNLDTLKGYLEHNPESDQWLIHHLEGLEVDLESISEYKPSNTSVDMDVLISATLEDSRAGWYCEVLRHAATISYGAAALKRGSDRKEDRGPEAAKAFLRKMWAQDYVQTNSELAGIWHENTEAIQQRLDNYLSTKNTRVKLGFGRIDRDWVIRHGKTVVIAGSSGDGKSTFLNSAVYNMARRGERILYVSLEFSPEEIWEFLAFLHVRRFKDRLYLPSLAQWQQHTPDMPTITPEHRKRMSMVIEDIRRRASVPGLIDVQRFFTLDDIINYYEAHKAKHRYTVVVIDYLGRLNIDVGQYQKEKEVRDQLARTALAWCAKENSFVLISPSQVNRESHKSQKKNKDGGYDLDALFNSSALQHDVDLAMSVYSDDDLKQLGQIQVKCLKWRGTNRFKTHELTLDLRTKYVFDPDDDDTADTKHPDTLEEAEHDEFRRKTRCQTATGEQVAAILGAKAVSQ